MLDLLITLLVMILIFGVIYWVFTLIPLPAPFAMIAQVLIAVIFIVVLISMVFGGVGLPFHLHSRG